MRIVVPRSSVTDILYKVLIQVINKLLAVHQPSVVAVSRSRISLLAADMKKNGGNGKMGQNGEMGGSGGKWRKMGGGGWGKWGNVRKSQKYPVGNVEKMCEIWRKLEENRRKMRQFGAKFPFFPVPFCPFFHLPPFPQVPFMNFASRIGCLEKWGISH